MAKPILGVSWLNGSFKAVALRGGVAAGTWTCPLRVEKLEELQAVLSQAVTETQFTGNEVVFLLEHRSLIYHLQETPPAKKRIVRKLLDRAVVQNKFFEEPAVWGSQQAPSAKGKLRHVLNIVPRSLLDGLTAACRELQLELRGVFPATVVLGGQLDKLSGSTSNDTVLLAADLAGVLCLLVGRSEGQILFSRSVVGLSVSNRERIEQEINRTLLYSQQQFGVGVNQVCLFGDGAKKLLEGLPTREALNVGVSPVAEDEFFYAREAARIVPEHPANVVSQAEPRRRRIQHWLSAAAAVTFLCAAAQTLLVEVAVRGRELQAQLAESRMAEEARKVQQLLAQQRQLTALQTFARRVGRADEPPVAELFLRFLGASLTNSLRLDQLELTETPQGWAMRLQGTPSEATASVIPLVEKLEETLAKSVFKVQVTNSTRLALFRSGPDESLRPVARGVGRPDSRTIFVEGIIR